VNDEQLERAGDAEVGAAGSAFEVLGEDGQLVRYAADDFDEVFTTTDEHEARRHVRLGWILLDERVGREGGKPALDAFLRRAAGRVLPAADDPRYEAPDHVTAYVLGYLKAGRSGTSVG